MLTLVTAVLCAQLADAGVVTPVAPPSDVSFRAGAEVEGAAFGTSREIDGLLGLRPLLSFSVKDTLEVELGPSFRLRLFDAQPSQKSTDLGGILRREDWDSLSDFGQIVRELRLDTSALQLRVGSVRKKTLGFGHLINRYSNADNPDYHPAGATAVLNIGPVHAEAFASDLLGARLFAAQFSFDLGKFLSDKPQLADRFLATIEVAHDFGLAGRPVQRCAEVCFDTADTVPITLGHFDASAVVLRNFTIRLMVLAGAGGRGVFGNDKGSRGFGALFGTAADLNIKSVRLTGRVELRKNNLGFRQGFIGPGYELARFSGIGRSQASIGMEQLPDGYSLFSEIRSAWSDLVTADAMVEVFSMGRIDVDATASVNLIGSRLVGAARFTAVGLNQAARFSYSAELRYRPIASLYILAQGGSLYFPQSDGSLIRGGTVGVGIGGDIEL